MEGVVVPLLLTLASTVTISNRIGNEKARSSLPCIVHRTWYLNVGCKQPYLYMYSNIYCTHETRASMITVRIPPPCPRLVAFHNLVASGHGTVWLLADDLCWQWPFTRIRPSELKAVVHIFLMNRVGMQHFYRPLKLYSNRPIATRFGMGLYDRTLGACKCDEVCNLWNGTC